RTRMQLGSVTFANESPSGWQQAFFQTPIQILAGEIYVVSYFAPQKNYALDGGFFAPNGVDTPPLHALSDAQAGGDGCFHDDGRGNGVFLHSDTGVFPTNTFDARNYYVDVVFSDPTLSAPQVLSTTPAPGMTKVATDIAPTVTFSEPLDPTSLNSLT